MNPLILFVAITFIVGLVFQGLFFYLVPAGLPTPQWLLLVVLVVGSRGWTKSAMTLGFFWGLSLDAFGMTAFGVQGWLLALVGYVAGSFSKNLDSEKWETQEMMVLVASVLVWGGVRLMSRAFDHALVGTPGVGLSVVQWVLNGLVAPAIFWGVTLWADQWAPPAQKDHA